MTQDSSLPSTPTSGETEPAPAGDASACPTPLSCRQVLTRFEQESDRWEIDVDGETLHGHCWGSGPPIYFPGGIFGDDRLFALLIWLLRDDFRCVTVNLRPCRGSSRGKLLQQWSDDLLRAAEFHQDETFSLYATSLGVLVALRFLSEHSDRVSHVILQGGYADRRLTLAERGIAWLGRYLPGQLSGLPGHARLQQQNHRRWFPPFDASRWSDFLELVGPTSLHDVGQRAQLIHHTDLSELLPSISQEVLLITTEGDGPVLAAAQQRLADRLPDSRTESLTATGLFPYFTHPHRMAKLIRPFLLGDSN